jgi:hypothetical protein
LLILYLICSEQSIQYNTQNKRHRVHMKFCNFFSIPCEWRQQAIKMKRKKIIVHKQIEMCSTFDKIYPSSITHASIWGKRIPYPSIDRKLYGLSIPVDRGWILTCSCWWSRGSSSWPYSITILVQWLNLIKEAKWQTNNKLVNLTFVYM